MNQDSVIEAMMEHQKIQFENFLTLMAEKDEAIEKENKLNKGLMNVNEMMKD